MSSSSLLFPLSLAPSDIRFSILSSSFSNVCAVWEEGGREE